MLFIGTPCIALKLQKGPPAHKAFRIHNVQLSVLSQCKVLLIPSELFLSSGFAALLIGKKGTESLSTLQAQFKQICNRFQEVIRLSLASTVFGHKNRRRHPAQSTSLISAEATPSRDNMTQDNLGHLLGRPPIWEGPPFQTGAAWLIFWWISTWAICTASAAPLMVTLRLRVPGTKSSRSDIRIFTPMTLFS